MRDAISRKVKWHFGHSPHQSGPSWPLSLKLRLQLEKHVVEARLAGEELGDAAPRSRGAAARSSYRAPPVASLRTSAMRTSKSSDFEYWWFTSRPSCTTLPSLAERSLDSTMRE